MNVRWVVLVVAATAVLGEGVSYADGPSPSEPTVVQCLAANERSIELRRAKKYKDASEALSICVARSCPTEVRKECERRSRETTPQVPTVVVRVEPVGGAPLPELQVTLDGQVIPGPFPSVPLSVNPGEHALKVEAPGQTPLFRTIVVREGEKDHLETFVLSEAGKGAGARASIFETAPPSRSSEGGLRTGQWAGIVLGGVGALGLGLSGVTGMMAAGKWSDAKSACPRGDQCPDHARAVEYRDQALSAATLSTVSFVAGAAALAGGLTLYIVSTKDSSSGEPSASVGLRPTFGMGQGGFALDGRF